MSEKTEAVQEEANAIGKLILKKRVMRAPKILISGPNKIGKTTFAAAAPKAIGLLAEDPGSIVAGDSFPIIKNMQQLQEYLNFLEKEKHSYQSVFLDSLDWLEPVVQEYVCRANNWASIETPGYGKGYHAATLVWRDLFNSLDRVNARGIAIIAISHVKMKSVSSPIVEPFDAYVLKVHDKAAGLASEWADILGFCAPKLLTTTSTAGFSQTTRAIATGERTLYLESNPSFPSGNRYSLKDQPLDAGLFWKNLNAVIAANK